MIVTRSKLIKLIESFAGMFFSVGFFKKNGEYRTMVARTGVKAHRHTEDRVSPAVKPTNPYVCLFDTHIKEYRLVNLETIDYIKCGKVYTVS